MSGLRLHSSTFTGKIAAYLANQKNHNYATVMTEGGSKGGSLPSHFHLNTQLCLQPAVSGVLLQRT